MIWNCSIFNPFLYHSEASFLSEIHAFLLYQVMITGDQALTACHVASQVHITSKQILILNSKKGTEEYEWLSPDELQTVPYRWILWVFEVLTLVLLFFPCFSTVLVYIFFPHMLVFTFTWFLYPHIYFVREKEVGDLSEMYDLCIGGDCIEMLQRTFTVLDVIPYIKVLDLSFVRVLFLAMMPTWCRISELVYQVFARVAPEQKELILTTFKTVGRMTLMCGDGTNDVGALKQVLS